MNNGIMNKLLELAEGKLTANEWANWFNESEKDLEKIFGRRMFLKIKPKKSFSNIRNIYLGQLGVLDWLNSKNIPIAYSCIYKKNYEEEFRAACKKEREKRQATSILINNKYSYLQEVYPHFFKQLIKSCDEFTILEKGTNKDIIKAKEDELSLEFSEDLKRFFSQISKLECEGFQINFDHLQQLVYQGDSFLVLGEYWAYGDGDPLLYRLSDHTILVFAHEYKKLIPEAKTITEFMEIKIVKYLKLQE